MGAGVSRRGGNVIEHWGGGALFGLYPLPGAVNAIAALTPAGNTTPF